MTTTSDIQMRRPRPIFARFARLSFAIALGLAVAGAPLTVAHAATPTAKQNKAQTQKQMNSIKVAKNAAKRFTRYRSAKLYKEIKSANALTAKENAALTKMQAAKTKLDGLNTALSNDPGNASLSKQQSAAYSKHLKAESKYNDVAGKANLARSKANASRVEYEAAKRLISSARKAKLAEQDVRSTLKITDAAAAKVRAAEKLAGAGNGQVQGPGNHQYAGINLAYNAKLTQARADHAATQTDAQRVINFRDAMVKNFNSSRTKLQQAAQARQNNMPNLNLGSAPLVGPGTPSAYVKLQNLQ